MPSGKDGDAIRYGFELLANTSRYLGPKGTVGAYAGNQLNCRNCHLDVGMREFGNSWLDTHLLYPQYRQREGKVQTLAERINACMIHNLLGKPIPLDGNEMTAMLSYYRWLSRGRVVPEKDPEQRLPSLPFLKTAANVELGRKVFESKCTECHGANGLGRLDVDGRSFVYPPLWGKQSFMTGSSMSRLSLLARFVKGNMPYQSKPGKPLLSDEDAWNVAAFVLSHERPAWVGPVAFQLNIEKPFDFPIGPYADPFPDEQHRLGPFEPIINFWVDKFGESARKQSSGI
ncbi:unnamed protein product [Sphagnum jensenii]